MRTPSSLIEVDQRCGYLCYCFDEAVLYFGRWVENKLNLRHQDGNNEGKPIYTLAEILDPNFVEKRQVRSLRNLLAFMGPAAGFVDEDRLK